jgi:hypothetical protein
MKRFLHFTTTLFFMFALLFASPTNVFASEGNVKPQFEMEVNGYHVGLSSNNEWVKGENTLVVTIADSMGMPVSDADVEILIMPKSDAHTEADEHAEPETDTHVAESSHDSMSGMDMGGSEPETPEASAHEEKIAAPLAMSESHEHGEYTVTAHLESSGEYDVQVFFRVDGEMLQADFVVEVPGMASKTIVLWSFVAINVGLVVSAGVLKNNSFL